MEKLRAQEGCRWRVEGQALHFDHPCLEALPGLLCRHAARVRDEPQAHTLNSKPPALNPKKPQVLGYLGGKPHGLGKEALELGRVASRCILQATRKRCCAKSANKNPSKDASGFPLSKSVHYWLYISLAASSSASW